MTSSSVALAPCSTRASDLAIVDRFLVEHPDTNGLNPIVNRFADHNVGGQLSMPIDSPRYRDFLEFRTGRLNTLQDATRDQLTSCLHTPSVKDDRFRENVACHLLRSRCAVVLEAEAKHPNVAGEGVNDDGVTMPLLLAVKTGQAACLLMYSMAMVCPLLQ